MYMYRDIQYDILRYTCSGHEIRWKFTNGCPCSLQNKLWTMTWSKQKQQIQDEKYYNFTKILPKIAVTVSTIQSMNRLFTLCFLINLSRSHFDYFQITFSAIMHKVFVFTHPMSLMYFWKSLYIWQNFDLRSTVYFSSQAFYVGVDPFDGFE